MPNTTCISCGQAAYESSDKIVCVECGLKEDDCRCEAKRGKNVVSPGDMVKKINTFIKRMCKQYKSEENFRIEIERRSPPGGGGDNIITLVTDEFVYDMLYNPSSSDFPRIGYRESAKFHAMLKKAGWNWEAEGGGVIRLYRD